MNNEGKKEIKRIIESIFISGNLTSDLSSEVCNDYYEQILEVIGMDSLSTGP